MNFIPRKKRIWVKNFFSKIQFLIIVFAFVLLVNPVYSAFNEQINYQGKLTDSSNQAVADGTYNIEFKIYDAVSGGTLLWTETCTTTNKVTITNGLFSHLLGSVNVLPDNIFNQNVWLSVNIGSTTTEPVWDGEMSPRKKIGSVPSAFEAKRLSGKLESAFAGISETESISGLWTFSATTTLATTTISSSTITVLNAVSLNVNGTSSTLWDQAYHYFNASSTNLNTTHFIVNASSTNWDWTHDYVFASSTNWDAAYHWGDHALAGYLTTVDISANTNLTVTATGLQLSGDSIALTAGYNIPTNASTTAWNSSTYAVEQGSGKWNTSYGQAHATATENITGIDLTGQLFSLTAGYIIPLSASTTNWNNFYDTPSGRITAGDHIDWTANTLNVLDDWWNALSDMTLTQGYIYVGDSSNNPIATSTLFISGQKVGIATTTMTGALSIEGGAYLGPTSTAPATANGMMYYNVTENKFKCYQNSAWVDCIASGSSPAGSDTQIQYNNGGSWGADADLTWNSTTRRLSIFNSTNPHGDASILINGQSGVTNNGDSEIIFTNASEPAYAQWKVGVFNTNTDDDYGQFRIIYDDSQYVDDEYILSIDRDIRDGAGTSFLFGIGTTTPTSTLTIYPNDPNGYHDFFRIYKNDQINTAFIVDKYGNVGIGTSTPVSGISLTIENGLLLNPTTTRPTATNGAMYYDSLANKFKCYENGTWINCVINAWVDGEGTSTQIAYWTDADTLTSTSSFVWDNTNGRLGVGTSTPSTTFQVYGTSTLRDIVPDASLTYNLGASTTRWNNAWISNIYLGTSTWVISQAKDGRIQFLNSPDSGKEIFTIASNGNVGVGTSTPASNFSIDGGLLLAPTTTVPLAVNGSMYYDSTDGKFKCYQAGAWTNCIGTGGTGEPGGSDSYIQYNNSGSFGGEKTFVWDDTNDRMGVGTSTPTSSLEIFSSTTNPILTISSAENASSYDPRIRLSAGSGTPVAKFNIGYDYSEDMFRIVAGDTITANKGLEITPLLEVGIGTSSRPTYSLNTIDAYFEGDTIFAGLGTFNNGVNITGLLSVTGDISYSGTITDINPDLAEKFPTKDETIESGDVVAVDVFNKEYVVKTDKEYQTNAMGVVSTNPGIILGGLTENNGANVALSGRIPAKVNLNNGEIKAGDYLTSSDIPGIAMKATKAGKVLGIALEDFSQTDFDSGKDRIIMFVDPQFMGNDLVIASDSAGQVVTQYQLTLQDIQNQLSSIGIVLNQDGYFEAKTVKAKKLITEQIELIDKTTQELHCIWYENGNRYEEIGACKDVLEQQVNSSAVPQGTTSSSDSQTTETTTTQETSSSTQTTPDQTNQPDASVPKETQQTLPPETVLNPEPEPVTDPVEVQPSLESNPAPSP